MSVITVDVLLPGLGQKLNGKRQAWVYTDNDTPFAQALNAVGGVSQPGNVATALAPLRGLNADPALPTASDGR